MTVFDGVSLTLALVALVVSAFLAHRQNLLQKTIGNTPGLVDLMNQFRTERIHESFEWVTTELAGYDPTKGLIGLPAELRYKVYDVCYFLQQFACLIVLDIIAERPFTALLRARTLAVWQAAGPFIEYERKLNPATGPEFMAALEAFATKAQSISPEIGRQILAKWVSRPV